MTRITGVQNTTTPTSSSTTAGTHAGAGNFQGATKPGADRFTASSQNGLSKVAKANWWKRGLAGGAFAVATAMFIDKFNSWKLKVDLNNASYETQEYYDLMRRRMGWNSGRTGIDGLSHKLYGFMYDKWLSARRLGMYVGGFVQDMVLSTEALVLAAAPYFMQLPKKLLPHNLVAAPFKAFFNSFKKPDGLGRYAWNGLKEGVFKPIGKALGNANFTNAIKKPGLAWLIGLPTAAYALWTFWRVHSGQEQQEFFRDYTLNEEQQFRGF
ncbi:MAG: hypothetical protein KTR14_08425 [Vampirovibrio sp.]|nr:hypothetical protein [Vampirovibrio sp.]